MTLRDGVFSPPAGVVVLSSHRIWRKPKRTPERNEHQMPMNHNVLQDFVRILLRDPAFLFAPGNLISLPFLPAGGLVKNTVQAFLGKVVVNMKP